MQLDFKPVFISLISLSLVSLLNGCSWFSTKEDINPPEPLVEFAAQFQPRSLWQTKTPVKLKDNFLQLRPLVFEQQLIITSPAGDVESLSLENGQTLWSQRLKFDLTSGAGVGEEMILVGGRKGEVIALSLAEGKELWRAQVSSEVLSPPQIARGIVIVRSVDGKLTALSAKDGISLWSYQRQVPLLSLRGTSSPIIDGSVVYAGFDNGRLSALNLSDGKPLWETRLSQPSGRSELERMVDIDANLSMFRGVLFVTGYQGRTAAIDLSNGDILWNKDTSSYSGLAVDDLAVYLSDSQSHLQAFDRYTGRVLWKQDKLQYRRLTAPVSQGDYLVVGDFAGYLHWLRKEDGQFVARSETDKSGLRLAPIATESGLVVLTNDGRLSLLQVPTE